MRECAEALGVSGSTLRQWELYGGIEYGGVTRRIPAGTLEKIPTGMAVLELRKRIAAREGREMEERMKTGPAATLRQARERLGLSVVECALRVGVPAELWEYWERSVIYTTEEFTRLVKATIDNLLDSVTSNPAPVAP